MLDLIYFTNAFLFDSDVRRLNVVQGDVPYKVFFKHTYSTSLEIRQYRR